MDESVKPTKNETLRCNLRLDMRDKLLKEGKNVGFVVVILIKVLTSLPLHEKRRLACKEINMGGHRGWRLRVVEAFIIILAFTQLLYVLALHSGVFSMNYGTYYGSESEGNVLF